MDQLDEAARSWIDETLTTWRQGDFVLGEFRFLFQLDVDTPLTPPAREAASEGADAAEEEVVGLAVVSHSCDIARSCHDRPFVQVCPLTLVDNKTLKQVKRCRLPRFVFLPATERASLVVDLERVMTVEKAVVAGWSRLEGLRDDNEARRFRLGLTRKLGRSPFPDDFVEFARRLSNRISDKHDVNSAEGRALRALREIRVRAAPAWDSSDVTLTFLFIPHEGVRDFEGQTWDSYLDQWLGLIPSQGRFTRVDGVVQTLDDISGREYVESDPLDLDHLSTRDKLPARKHLS